jgi:hypothetical protein
MSVTIFASCYGNYDKYAKRWFDAIDAMTVKPDAIIVATDKKLKLPASVEQHIPQTYSSLDMTFKTPIFNNWAISYAETEWVWRCDIDDQMASDAIEKAKLNGCDVYHGGYINQHGQTYIPGNITAAKVLKSPFNPIASGSAFTRDIWGVAGGFPAIAYDDWGFWRRVARHKAKFVAAGRVTYTYDHHPETSLSGKHMSDESTRIALAQ